MSDQPVNLQVIRTQRSEPVILVEAGEARDDGTGRLLWSHGNLLVSTDGEADPRRYDAQIVALRLSQAAAWAGGMGSKRGLKLARKLNKLLKQWERE